MLKGRSKLIFCCFVVLPVILVIYGSSCGGVKSTSSIDKAVNDKKSSETSKDTSLNENNLKTIQKIKISKVFADTSYKLVFYNTQKNITYKYGVWQNNPFDIKLESKPRENGKFPLRYIVPNLTKSQLIDKVPYKLLEDLNDSIIINRIDVFVVIPHDLNSYYNYLPVLYQINAMQGYEEEYEIPASFGIIKIINNKGEVIKSIEVDNPIMFSPVISQNGKYLLFINANKSRKLNCINIFNVFDNHLIKKECYENHNKIGIGYLGNNMIGGEIDFANDNKSKFFIISSDKDLIFSKTFDFIRYAFKKIDENRIAIFREHDSNKSDTLVLIKDFQITKTEK